MFVFVIMSVMSMGVDVCIGDGSVSSIVIVTASCIFWLEMWFYIVVWVFWCMLFDLWF